VLMPYLPDKHNLIITNNDFRWKSSRSTAVNWLGQPFEQHLDVSAFPDSSPLVLLHFCIRKNSSLRFELLFPSSDYSYINSEFM